MILGSPRAYRLSSPTRWYLVFCEVERRRWWDRVFRTRPGFSHVYALRWDGWNWILYNPHVAYTDVAIIAAPSENALHLLVEPDATVVEVEAYRAKRRIRGRWWVGPMTCVEQVKALLGLPVGRIWTPWQLYRYLVEDCAHGHQTENTGTDGAGAGARAPTTATARRIDPRGKRTP